MRTVVSLVSTVRDIDRLRQILVVLARHGFGEVVQRTGLGRLVRPSGSNGSTSDLSEVAALQPDADRAAPVRRIEVGERLRLVLQDLGPSFVKLGQILSTRSDLIPPDVVAELSKLQDQVTPLSFEVIRTEVESELGAPIDVLFARFDRTPLASASIAQVHRARLHPEPTPTEGAEADDARQEVVIKVQRPRIRSVIARDVELLYLLARAIERSIPESRIYSPVGLANEFDRAISAELDFTREADNAERFRQAFAEEPEAHFPQIHRDLCSRRVITMEFLSGHKLPRALEAGYRGPDLARVALRVIFRQIFQDGFFHGDPHPGNLLIMGEVDAPVLGMIDLGLVGRLSPNLRDKTVDLMLSAARRDSQGIADALYTIGTPTRKIDRNRYVAEVTFLSDRYLGRPLKEIEVSLLVRDIIAGATKFGLEIPPEFLMLGRTLMTVEGIGKRLDPDLDVFSEIRPFFVRLVQERYSPERMSENLFRTMTRFGETAHRMPERLDEILEDLRRGELTMAVRNDLSATTTDRLGRRLFGGLAVAGLLFGGANIVASGRADVVGYVMIGTACTWIGTHLLRRWLSRMTGP